MASPSTVEQAEQFLESGDFHKAEELARGAVLNDRDDLAAWTVRMESTCNTKTFRECASNVVRLTTDGDLKRALTDLLENYVFFIMRKVAPRIPGSIDGVSNQWECGVWIGKGLHTTAVLGKILYWNAERDFRIDYRTDAPNGVPVCADNFTQRSIDEEDLPLPVYRSVGGRMGTVKLYLDKYIQDNVGLLELEGCLRMRKTYLGSDGSVRIYRGHHLIEFDRVNEDPALRGYLSTDMVERDMDLKVVRTKVKVRSGLFRKEERDGIVLSLVPHSES